MSQTPLDVLRSVYGYKSFVGLQEGVINHMTEGGDALVFMPTGGGKSLCYQIPAMIRQGVGVIISPLIALMRDQVGALVRNGARAACLNSGLSASEAWEVERRLGRGELDLLYVAPERLMTPGFMSVLERLQIALFAIDEAHCVSQWGHDFRPEYLQLAVLKEKFPQVPRIALTATADGPTRADIMTRLHFQNARIFSAGFDRPNIRYIVVPKNRGREQLLEFIENEHKGDSGIVYRMSRKKVEETCEWLNAKGIESLPYHAGLDKRSRDASQDAFMKKEGLVMVATVAFGMGVDKPDVRFVAHLDPPKSLEAYHQETGRAGRDGLPADAWMSFGMGDMMVMRKIIAPDGDAAGRKRIELQKFNALTGFCEAISCRRQILLGYFGETHEPCGNCDLCLNPVETVDGTVAAQKALSCVFRTGQRFGAAHLINVLTGKHTKAILQWGHDEVSTFGVGREHSPDQWRGLYRQLIADGSLEIDPEGFGSLRLTKRAWEILKGGRTFAMRLESEPEKKERKRKRERRERKPKAGWAGEFLQTPEETRLFDALRALRRKLAEEEGAPAYQIFQDKTLLGMALLKPRREEELLAVTGVGQSKLEKYGAAFLEALAAQYDEHGRGEPRAVPGEEKIEAEVKKKAERGETAQKTLELFRALGSVEAVAAERSLTPHTICSHLIQAVGKGELAVTDVFPLDPEAVKRVEKTLASFKTRGITALKPVFEALEGEFDYEVIRCVQSGMWARGKKAVKRG